MFSIFKFVWHDIMYVLKILKECLIIFKNNMKLMIKKELLIMYFGSLKFDLLLYLLFKFVWIFFY